MPLDCSRGTRACPDSSYLPTDTSCGTEMLIDSSLFVLDVQKGLKKLQLCSKTLSYFVIYIFRLYFPQLVFVLFIGIYRHLPFHHFHKFNFSLSFYFNFSHISIPTFPNPDCVSFLLFSSAYTDICQSINSINYISLYLFTLFLRKCSYPHFLILIASFLYCPTISSPFIYPSK